MKWRHAAAYAVVDVAAVSVEVAVASVAAVRRLLRTLVTIAHHLLVPGRATPCRHAPGAADDAAIIVVIITAIVVT